MKINYSGIETAIHQYLEGVTTSSVEIIHTRSGDRGDLLRLSLVNGDSVVVKVWRVRDLKERFKSVTFLSNGRREWRMHRKIYQTGIVVPEPLAFYRLTLRDGAKYEAMVVEDLGQTTSVMSYLKQLIAVGDEPAVLALENDLIEITAMFIEHHILDIDHQMNNFLLDTRGRLIRTDFECARRYPFRIMPKKEYVKMLARFIIGHIHVVQPDLERSVSFADRLYKKLNVGHRIKTMVSDNVYDKSWVEKSRHLLFTIDSRKKS